MPIGFRVGNLEEKIAALRRRAEEAGRDPSSISVSIFGAKPDRKALDGLERAGAERAIFMAPPEGRDKILPIIDQYAGLIR
jgi:alkanesulfonate monooxygenase SsuD/methylene tetrahydromethanopterin reductase-like flavin-dependent oxidoreductase (luciferase family)